MTDLNDRATAVWWEVLQELQTHGQQADNQRVQDFLESALQAWQAHIVQPSAATAQALRLQLDEAQAALGLLALSRTDGTSLPSRKRQRR